MRRKRKKRYVINLYSIWMILLWAVSLTYFEFVFVFRKRKKKRRNPVGWEETFSVLMLLEPYPLYSLTHKHTPSLSHTQIYFLCVGLLLRLSLTWDAFLFHPITYLMWITSSLMNPAVIVFWSSILHPPPPHRVLILPAAPPQSLRMR